MNRNGLLGRKAKLAVIAALLSVGGLVMAPAAAFAASPNGQTITETNNVHGVFFEPNATNPCNGDTFDGGQGVQFTGNLVNHITAFTNSDEAWFTFTETGKVVGTDDGTGVTYTGKATAWGNGNFNERNQNSEFTLTIHLTGSDGSSITLHETTVFVNNGNGDITVNIDKDNHTCG
jgi:ABC-type oligopeptide transport system substrate-binding subunit